MRQQCDWFVQSEVETHARALVPRFAAAPNPGSGVDRSSANRSPIPRRAPGRIITANWSRAHFALAPAVGAAGAPVGGRFWGRGPGRGRAGVLVRGCRAMELTAEIRVLLQVQHGIICLHRSHFGSRYKTGCCGHAGLLIFWPRFDPWRRLKLENRTNHLDHSATFHMSLCVTTCSGRRPQTIADVRAAT